MAVTGFWPVKGQLKAVLDYADNPVKFFMLALFLTIFSVFWCIFSS